MREILFRGKKESTGDWVFGDLRHYRSGKVGIHSDVLRYTLLVDPETVGQYTGLKDKNGVKIFEGDILRCNKDKCVGVVCFGKYNDFDYGFCIEWKYGKGYYREDIVYWLEEENAEVIGNIHDNPELLKEGGEE